jgi:hypothetical protein
LVVVALGLPDTDVVEVAVLRSESGTADESPEELLDVALTVLAGLRKADTRPPTNRTTTTTVAASMRRERLPGSGDSPTNHVHHCCIACDQSFIEQPPHRHIRSPRRWRPGRTLHPVGRESA